MLSKKVCKSKESLDDIENAIFHLARKQHRIVLWSPRKTKERFRHTNIRLKTSHPLFLKPMVALELYFNRKKRQEKRYDAVFVDEKGIPGDFIKTTVDEMKEKTKENVNVKV